MIELEKQIETALTDKAHEIENLFIDYQQTKVSAKIMNMNTSPQDEIIKSVIRRFGYLSK